MTIYRQLRTYDRLMLAACFVAILTTFSLDLFLLERKYEIFAGGFLQSRQIAGFHDVSLFVLALFLCEAFLFFAVAGIWGAAARWIGARRVLNAYHFLFVCGGISIAVLVARYQILSYFTDFLNFAVLKDLGGGSLKNAIVYGLAEGRLFVTFTGAGILAYLAGHLLLLRWVKRSGAGARLSGTGRLYVATALIAMLGLALLIIAINKNERFRYHLNRTSAYSYGRELFDTLTDFDRDGYGFFAWWPDPAPFDPKIYPNALDVPGDGIDQDGLMGDFVYTPAPQSKVLLPEEKQNLIVVVLESARADVLDATVAGKPVTPVLRGLAARGRAAANYYSHTGFTASSIKAMFSGSLGGPLPFGQSLFALLKEQGYQVVVISGQDESFGDIAEALRMHESSVEFFDANDASAERVFPSAARTSLTLSNDRVLRQLAEISNRLDWRKPVFMYVNFQSAHFPYYYPGMPKLLDGVDPLPRSEIRRENKTRLWHTYLNAIANADAAVGRLIAEFERRGVIDNTLLVVSGDHGESLFDDGLLGHGHQLNDVQRRTLLVTNRKLPGFDGLLGQADLALELLKGIGAQFIAQDGRSVADAYRKPDQVFQIIGSIDQPTAIGFVDAQRKRITFNMASREAYFDTLGRWITIEDVRAYPEEAARLEQLIKHWERTRWEHHLANRKTGEGG